MRHVVEYDKLRFQPEIICNAVCEECLQISIYIYPLFFSNGVTRHVVEYDKLRFHARNSFVMLYVKNVCNWCHATCC